MHGLSSLPKPIVGVPTDPAPKTLEMTRLEKNPAVEALRSLGGRTEVKWPTPRIEKEKR